MLTFVVCRQFKAFIFNIKVKIVHYNSEIYFESLFSLIFFVYFQDKLLFTIAKYENDAKEANDRSDKADCDIRDLGKKCQSYEVEFDETNDKLTKVIASLEENC